MQEEINTLKEEVASLREHPQREEGEILEMDKEAIKEEITKNVTNTLEGKMDAACEGWVEIVKKNIKKEVQKDAQVMQSTFDEEKMRRICHLNIQVTGILDNTTTLEVEGHSL